MLTNSTLIFLITIILVCYSIRKIIYIANKKHLFDEPSEVRKIHHTKTPNLGGVAIISSMMFTSCIFLSYPLISHLNYIVLSSLILFILGLTDDLVGVNPTKKILAQLVVALTITILAKYRFTSFYGLFGLGEMPVPVCILLSTVFIMFLINAFNLIDGINCLAGSIGFLVCAIFAFYFWQMHHTELLFLALAMCGSLGGFLFFNRTPARIFMGDTGSMFLGFIVAFFSINFIELNKAGYTGFVQPQFQSAPALVFGLLIIPVFDTCRVFILRILKKKSPFLADRNHIHHRLIDLNLSHLQATGVLLIVNIITLLPVFLLAKFRTEIVLLVMLVFVLVLNRILSVIHNKNLIKKVVKIEDFNYPEPTHRILVRNKTVLK